MSKAEKTDKTILAITDFTKSSTNAILFASRLFKNVNLKIILLNVFENRDEKMGLLISVEDILSKDSESSLKKQSAEIAYILKSKNINISTHSMAGKYKKAIDVILQQEEIDLIVAGIPTNKETHISLSQKDPFGNKLPLLFMGQSKYPVLLAPEHCSKKPLKSILVLNLDSYDEKGNFKKAFEHIINHDHLAKHTFSINEKEIDRDTATSIHNALIKQKADIVIIVPSSGDIIDKAMLEYHIPKLYTSMISLLNG